MPCPVPLNTMDLPALGAYIEKISRKKERHPLVVSEAWQENFMARGFAECLA
jgi:hypothetical protein